MTTIAYLLYMYIVMAKKYSFTVWCGFLFLADQQKSAFA